MLQNIYVHVRTNEDFNNHATKFICTSPDVFLFHEFETANSMVCAFNRAITQWGIEALINGDCYSSSIMRICVAEAGVEDVSFDMMSENLITLRFKHESSDRWYFLNCAPQEPIKICIQQKAAIKTVAK